MHHTLNISLGKAVSVHSPMNGHYETPSSLKIIMIPPILLSCCTHTHKEILFLQGWALPFLLNVTFPFC